MRTIFPIIAITIWFSIHYYVGRNFIRPRELTRKTRTVVWTLILGAAAMMPAGFIIRFNVDNQSAFDFLFWFSYLLMGPVIFCFWLFLLFDLYRHGRRIFDLIRSSMIAEAAPADAERRIFLHRAAGLAIAPAAIIGSGYGLYEARRAPTVVERDLFFPSLPPGLEGFRIAQISDIHLGPTIKADYLARIVEITNSLSPDIVAHTGDLVDGTVKQLGPEAAPLAELASKRGVYFVTGNHEYYSGVEPWIELLTGLGHRVLKNSNSIIEVGGARLAICGVTDYRGGSFGADHRCDPEGAVRNTQSADFRLLLAHQPLTAIMTDGLGLNLQLSGHTHGGQFLPWHLFVAAQQKYLAGLYRRGEMQIYVNRGTGYWGPPVRVGSRSEISLITLRRG